MISSSPFQLKTYRNTTLLQSTIVSPLQDEGYRTFSLEKVTLILEKHVLDTHAKGIGLFHLV